MEAHALAARFAPAKDSAEAVQAELASGIGFERSMRTPETLEAPLLDWKKYEALARRATAIANAA